MKANRSPRSSPSMIRVMMIALDHIMEGKRAPLQLAMIGKRLGVPPSSVLALAIAEQVCEEFKLIPIKV